MTFDEIEMKYRNTIIVESSILPKPSLIEYRDYLNKYLDNIMNFIDYHLELEEPYNNLPKINYKFLYQMQQRLTTLDDYTKTYFYSPADMAIKLNLDDNIDQWNKEEDYLKIIGVSWINFKITYLWYKKLIDLGYNNDITPIYDADD